MKTSVYIGTSLDGFIAREDGDLDWLTGFANDEAVKAYEEFIRSIDVIVVGRGTFEKVLSFPTWPYEKKVFVLSTTLKQLPGNVGEKATLICMNPGEILKYLSGRGYLNIYVDGGKLIQSFLRSDLVDELIISKAPVLLGKGIPLFGSLDADLQFTHLRNRVNSNGLVTDYYERKRD